MLLLHTFSLVFLKFSLILILYKLDNSYSFPLGKCVMHRHELTIMFATLGQLAAEILVSFRYTTLFFGDFSLYFNVYINIHKHLNDTIWVRLAPLNRFKPSSEIFY